jgi:hypothetical protein
MLGPRFHFFGRVNDKLISASSNCHFIDRPHMASFDFAPELLPQILAGLPPRLAQGFTTALSCYPFQAYADLMIEADVDTKLGGPVNVRDQLFVPFVTTRVFG